jgi:hypothetical protein
VPQELWGKDLPTGLKTWLNILHPTQRYRWLADQVAYIGPIPQAVGLGAVSRPPGSLCSSQ